MARVIVRASDRVPTPSQQRAMDARDEWVALLGGYGSGKTSTGAEIALDLAAANAGQDGMIVAPTWGLLYRVTLPAFVDKDRPWVGACPGQLVAEDRRGAKAPNILLVNGSRVFLGSAGNPGSLEGANLSWIWGDEARLYSKEAWQIIVGRLRFSAAKRLQGVLTTTPSWGWLHDEFAGKKAEGSRRAFHMSTRENAPHLAPGYIASLERTYSKRLAKSLIEGQWGSSENAVYPTFDMDTVHGIAWKYEARFQTVGVIDFGRRRPAVTLWQEIPFGWKLSNGKRALDNSWVCFRQYHLSQVSTAQLADHVREDLEQKKIKVAQWFCDPAGNATTSAGISDVHVLENHGLRPVNFTTDDELTHIPNGVDLVDGMLLNTLDETRLFVAKDLAEDEWGPRGIVRSMESYAYPEARQGRPVSDVPIKDGTTDHACDCVRYLVINLVEQRGLSGPRYVRIR